MAPQGDDHYHPVDAVSGGVKGALATGGIGLFTAAIQNSLAKQNVGAWGVFTRGGGVIMSFGEPPIDPPALLYMANWSLLLTILSNSCRWRCLRILKTRSCKSTGEE